MAGEEAVATDGGGLLLEIVGSPLNLSLLGLCLFLLYQILRGERPAAQPGEAGPPPLPKMKRRDFTLEQLRPYDGVRDPRILMAVNGKVFDVTRASKFYGPGEGRAAGLGSARSAARGFARRSRNARPPGTSSTPAPPPRCSEPCWPGAVPASLLSQRSALSGRTCHPRRLLGCSIA